MKELSDFLNQKNLSSKFKVTIGQQGGYINFVNTNNNTFTIALGSIASCISNMIEHPQVFTGDRKYNEKEWRDLGEAYYKDPAANYLSKVQTKPLFSTLSKIITWANDPDFNNIDTDNIIPLRIEALNKTQQKLTKLINLYPTPVAKSFENSSIIKQNHFSVSKIPSDIRKTGLLYSDYLLYRLILSLLTKPFVILSGLSGSGKTQLALTFAKWICEDESQIRFIAVGADWNNREYLLGYPNALNEGSYILPENNALTIIIEAVRNPQKPYFLILDEMNLSYVERYFADFLSAMESDENILLHPDTNEWTNCEIPANIKLPQNLFIIGTINVDETTYMFSPKVLDRANVIEFRISEKEMHTFLSEIKPLDKNAANTSGADMAASFVNLAGNKSFSLNEQKETTTAILIKFFTELKKTGAEFGYRTASEIYRFIAIAKELNTSMTDNELTDAVIIQKLLPKLHGSRKKIQPVLEALWILCLKEDAPDKSINNFLFTEELSAFSKYPLSAAKIISMYKSAGDNGFTSFAEA